METPLDRRGRVTGRRIRTILSYAILVATLILMAEGGAYLILSFRPTGNPLALRADEATLHIYYPQSAGHFFGVKPNYRQNFVSDEFETVVRANNRGFREDFEYDGGRLDIAAVGDSFTFGHGVNAGERYTDRLRELFPGRRVMSLAGPNGSAPPHYYLFLRQHPELIPKVLIVGLFPWNDMREDMDQTVLIYDDQNELIRTEYKGMAVNPDGNLVTPDRRNWVEPTWRQLVRHSNFGRVVLVLGSKVSRILWRPAKVPPLAEDEGLPVHSDRMSVPALESGVLGATARQSLTFVRKTAELVRANGGRTIVLYIPASYRIGDYSFFCQMMSGFSAAECANLKAHDELGTALGDWLAAFGIDYVNPTSDFRAAAADGSQLYYAKDGHWTAQGHALAAQLLALHLRAL